MIRSLLGSHLEVTMTLELLEIVKEGFCFEMVPRLMILYIKPQEGREATHSIPAGFN